MLISVRLTTPDRSVIAQAIGALSSKCRVIVVGFEEFSVKYQRETPFHCHILVDSQVADNTLRKAVTSIGFKGGSGQMSYNFSKRKESELDCLPYHCKGKAKGDFDVGILPREEIREANLKYWNVREGIESRCDKKSDRTPVYIQIAEYVKAHLKDFSTLIEGYVEDDGWAQCPQLKLNEGLFFRYAVRRYSEHGPLFDRQVIEKCWYFTLSRLNSEKLGDQFAVQAGNMPEFKCDVESVNDEEE